MKARIATKITPRKIVPPYLKANLKNDEEERQETSYFFTTACKFFGTTLQKIRTICFHKEDKWGKQYFFRTKE
jgi:hypothetical protein